MDNKIEYIEVNGTELPLKNFPDEVKAQVNTYEIVRGEYNKAVVNTQALADYMSRLGQQIQQAAQDFVDQKNAAKQAAAAAPDAVAE